MLLFLSDLHLGRGDVAESRAAERAACGLLRAYADAMDALYLVGDVYDQYLEYRHLVPKGFTRFQGLLAELTDGGLPVVYLTGNRDPWHVDYFTQELGVRVERGPLRESYHGVDMYIAHGDGLVPSDRAYTLLKPLLHHPQMARLYRMLLPGDSGYALARRVGRGLSTVRDTMPRPEPVNALRDHARTVLATTTASLVVHGHCHQAECSTHPGGTYLNPGYWFGFRTFARLDAAGPSLWRWTGTDAEPL